MQENGVGVEALTPAALGDRYPALETSGIEVAGLARDAGVLDPDEVVATLAETAGKAGATIELARRSPSIRRRPSRQRTRFGRSTRWSSRPARNEAARRRCRRLARAESLPGAGPRDRTGRCNAAVVLRRDTRVLLAAKGRRATGRQRRTRGRPDGLEPGRGRRVRHSDLDRVEQTAALDASRDRAWAGLCTATPDGTPWLGKSPTDSAWPLAGRATDSCARRRWATISPQTFSIARTRFQNTCLVASTRHGSTAPKNSPRWTTRRVTGTSDYAARRSIRRFGVVVFALVSCVVTSSTSAVSLSASASVTSQSRYRRLHRRHPLLRPRRGPCRLSGRGRGACRYS